MKTMQKMLGAMLGWVALGAGAAYAAEPAAAEEAKPTPYPLGVCVVSSDTLGTMGKPVAYEHEGRPLRFCCEDCVPKFKAEPAKYIAEIDAKIVEQQKGHYPLKTCVVSGEELGGAMGEPVEYVIDNRLVRLCCAGCIKKLNKEPAKYLKTLDEAIIKAGNEKYPTEKCLVSDEPLGSMGETIDVIVAGRLVKICCAGCKTKLNRDPAKYLALLDAAEKEAK